jgi:hypothetical protein
MRSSNVGEMVIHELIREYLMNFKDSTQGFKFGGDSEKEIYKAASSWLKAVLLTVGGIFVYKNKDALQGLGTIIVDKVKANVVDLATKAVTPESRMIAEATYVSRFSQNIKSEKIEAVAKSLVGMITIDTHELSKKIDVSDESSTNECVTSFNNSAAKSMKMIIDLCTSSSRSYPDSLRTSFGITGPALPNDITDPDDKSTAEYILLDVASIQLYNMLVLGITTYYDEVKASIDKTYKQDDVMNKKLSDKIESLLKTLSSNLNSILSPAKEFLVDS